MNLDRICAYVGLLTLLEGALLFIKTSKILIFEYLFLGHMRVGVPLLLVNIFTLLLSIGIGVWLVSEVFAIRLAPLLATSAAFTLVLGLALQETLGNLFAGIALQLDKPYEIGDWVEINSGGQKWIGQVHEISWRATILIGYGNEQLSIPNRILGQAQVSNYAHRPHPIARNHPFRVPFGTDLARAKDILLNTVKAVPGVSREVEPLILVSETTESWITLKVIYYISDFGLQYVVADEVISAALASLESGTIPLAPQRLLVVRGNEA
jgi:small-conductance mechanosensitive channel